jgi:hypothetical protein
MLILCLRGASFQTLDEEVATALTRGYLSSSILAVSTLVFDCFNRSLLLPLPRIDKDIHSIPFW